MTSSPTRTELYDVAKVTARILKSCGIPCFLVGGMACSAYGTTRPHQDIDMAVMTDEQQESVKQRLVQADPRFYLVHAKNPFASYKVLWFRLGNQYSFTRRACKVDILPRGTLNIPDVPPSKIREVQGVPVAPLLVLLCLKLQAWDHHGAAVEYRFQIKQPADERDIGELLDIAIRAGEKMTKEGWIPQTFIRQAMGRVPKYVRSFTNASTREKWRILGVA
ncbi:hypothetical protein V8B97DRAFT_1935566 [Scleroderma yunnanense]